MTTNRDPRVDPKAGDVVSKDGKTRTVTMIIDNTIESKTGRTEGWVWLAAWRRWCRGATVEKVAEETE